MLELGLSQPCREVLDAGAVPAVKVLAIDAKGLVLGTEIVSLARDEVAAADWREVSRACP